MNSIVNSTPRKRLLNEMYYIFDLLYCDRVLYYVQHFLTLWDGAVAEKDDVLTH